MTDQIQQDFLVAYIAETIRLEMDGPAHQVTRSNSLENPEFGKLISMHLQVQRDFIDGKLMEPDVEKIQWPWPGKTGTEIIKATNVPQQNPKNTKGKMN